MVSNAGTAWLYGCSSVNCSLLGIGERTGNCPLEAMAIEYEALRGTTDGMDLTAVTEIAEFMEREIGLEISPRQPFVGRHFNVTRAGIHADGLLKDEEIYNIFDTAAILNRPATVAVDAHSGLAGIAHWMNSYFRLKGKHQVDKQDALVVAVKEMVDDLYAERPQHRHGRRRIGDHGSGRRSRTLRAASVPQEPVKILSEKTPFFYFGERRGFFWKTGAESNNPPPPVSSYQRGTAFFRRRNGGGR